MDVLQQYWNEYLEVLKKYSVFTGRSRRREYWVFVLVNFAISIVLGMIDNALGLGSGKVGVLGGLYSLVVLIPGIAVTVRRLHDTNRSGWMALIGLIPLVGWIILLVFVAQDSDPQENQYGPNPKQSTVAATI